MTESTNYTLQFDRKMSQMTDFLLFTKVTYYYVHFRFRCCCFYSNPWAAILKKMSNDWIYKLHIAISQKNVSNDFLRFFLQKLLTAVSTSVSAAAAFIRTRGQQFLQMFDVLDGHFDNFSFFNPPTTFFEIIWRYQMGKVGQTTIHSITPPFFNNFVGQRILKKKNGKINKVRNISNNRSTEDQKYQTKISSCFIRILGVLAKHCWF